MPPKFSNSIYLEDVFLLQNRYENLEVQESSNMISSELEKHINKFLDSENVHIADPIEKIDAFFQKSKSSIFNKQVSKSQASISMTSIGGDSNLENYPTNVSLPQEECMKCGSTLNKEIPLEGEMILKGVESFKLLKRRKDEAKPESEKHGEEETKNE